MKKDIKNYEGLYFVNSLGEVFSYPKKTRKNIRKLKPLILNSGYASIDLCKNGTVKKYLLHRLICETFLENKFNKPQVNHINGIKTDNRIDNLEWSTRSENQLHAIKNNLRTTIGEKNSQCKLKEENILDIYNDKSKYSIIANKYNVSISTICDIKRGYSWTHITKLKNIKKAGKTAYIPYE